MSDRSLKWKNPLVWSASANETQYINMLFRFCLGSSCLGDLCKKLHKCITQWKSPESTPQPNINNFNRYAVWDFELAHSRPPARAIDSGKLILYSGGVLRELIRIANECCRICLQLIRRRPDRTDIKITDEILEQAVNNIRNDFALRLDKKDYAILQQVYQNFMPEDPAEPLYGRSLEICEQ